MRAIFKREMRAYFASPVGYVVVAALLALYGFFYYQVMAIGSSSYITQVFSTMFMFSMMIMPIITMRSMSDDRKNKTDQALITAPVKRDGHRYGQVPRGVRRVFHREHPGTAAGHHDGLFLLRVPVGHSLWQLHRHAAKSRRGYDLHRCSFSASPSARLLRLSARSSLPFSPDVRRPDCVCAFRQLHRHHPHMDLVHLAI